MSEPRHHISASPLSILWHYALGEMPDFLDKKDGSVGWVRWAHRGIHRMDHIVFPKSQERYIRSAKWEVKMNQRFEEVVRRCAANHSPTWIIDPLVDGLIRLHAMGYAHSWEAWQGTELVAGMFGVQLGGWVTLCSMYNTVRDASKAVVGRGLLMLKDRGFEFIDRGMVPNHLLNYGAEWWPRWQYEAAIPRLLRQNPSLTDKPTPPVPWQILRLAPLARFSRKVRERVLGEPVDPPTPQEPPKAEKELGGSEQASPAPSTTPNAGKATAAPVEPNLAPAQSHEPNSVNPNSVDAKPTDAQSTAA